MLRASWNLFSGLLGKLLFRSAKLIVITLFHTNYYLILKLFSLISIIKAKKKYQNKGRPSPSWANFHDERCRLRTQGGLKNIISCCIFTFLLNYRKMHSTLVSCEQFSARSHIRISRLITLNSRWHQIVK